MKKNKKFKSLSLLMALLMIVISVFIAPTATAEEESATTPLIVSEDYENVAAADFVQNGHDEGVFTIVSDGENNHALNVQLNRTGYYGANLISTSVPMEKNKTYHITGTVKIVEGTLNYLALGCTGNNYHNINTTPNSAENLEGGVPVISSWSSHSAPKTVDFSVTYISNVYTYFGFRMSSQTKTSTVQFDNIKIAEVIPSENIVATSADKAKGTAEVKNANTKYTNFAAGETAVFTATPADGYTFAGWVDSNGNVVSTAATYNHTVTGSVALTAQFKKHYEKHVLDYENFDVGTSSDGVNGWNSTRSLTVVDNGIGDGKSLMLDVTATSANVYTGIYLNIGPNYDVLTPGKHYRVSGKYQLLKGSMGRFAVGISNSVSVNGLHTASANTRHIIYNEYTQYKPAGVQEFVSTGYIYNDSDNCKRPVANVLSPSYVKDADNQNQILFDDIVYAEIIDTVKATSANPTFGDVSVVNKNSTLEGFAVGETAVFTATPKTGYKFVGWVDENGNAVEGGKTLEVVLESDTSLTAKFAEDEESTLRKNSDIYVDFENVTKIYTTDSANFTVVEEAGAEETNKVLYYKGSADTNSNDLSQNRISFTRTDVNTKLITEIAKPGEYITIRFRYKYLDANTASGRFYFHTIADSRLGNLWNSEIGKTDSFEQTITNNGTEWQTMSVTLQIRDSATNYDNLIAMIAVTGDIYFDDIQVYKPIDTAYNGVGALRAASSSATGKNGLRIYNNIDKSHSNDKGYAEYGSIAVRKEKLSNGDGTYKELTHSTTGYAEGVAFKRENWAEKYKKVIKIDDQGYTFTSYLVNIKPEFYNDVYVVRAYQKVAQSAEAFETAAYEYGDEVEVCVFDLANKIDNNPAASEIDKTAFYDFVNREANGTGTDTVALYKTWAEANGRTTGALYAALIAE